MGLHSKAQGKQMRDLGLGGDRGYSQSEKKKVVDTILNIQVEGFGQNLTLYHIALRSDIDPVKVKNVCRDLVAEGKLMINEEG